MNDSHSKLFFILNESPIEQLIELKRKLNDFGITIDQATQALILTQSSPKLASEYLLKYCTSGLQPNHIAQESFKKIEPIASNDEINNNNSNNSNINNNSLVDRNDVNIIDREINNKNKEIKINQSVNDIEHSSFNEDSSSFVIVEPKEKIMKVEDGTKIEEMKNEKSTLSDASTMLATVSRKTSGYTSYAASGISYFVPGMSLLNKGISSVSKGLDYYLHSEFDYGLSRGWGPKELRALCSPFDEKITVRVLIVRHGQDQGDQLNSTSFFHRDARLSEVGIGESKKLGEKLRTVDFLKKTKLLIITSPFIRCIETLVQIMGGNKWDTATSVSPYCAEHSNYNSHIHQSNRGTSILELNSLFPPELFPQFRSFLDLDDYCKQNNCKNWWYHARDSLEETDDQFNQRALKFKTVLLEECTKWGFTHVLIVSHQSLLEKSFPNSPPLKNCEFISFDMDRINGDLTRCEDTRLPAKDLIFSDVQIIDQGFKEGYLAGLIEYAYNPKVRLVGEVLGTKFHFEICLTEVRTVFHEAINHTEVMPREVYISYFPVKFPSSGVTSSNLFDWFQHFAIALQNGAIDHKFDLKEKIYTFLTTRNGGV